MKVGILTLHSQVNYGGVLQAYALQQTLEKLGCEVRIIDRWFDERNGGLKGIIASRSVISWIKFVVRALLGFGDTSDYIRHIRTEKWLPTVFKLTDYSFCRWEDAPKDLSVELIVVGSDQVWNPKLQGPELPYLLKGAAQIPAISYAASFGVKKIPEDLLKFYREGFSRFKRISLREKEGCELVRAAGFECSHVVDPTLLIEESEWRTLIRAAKKHALKKKLVCYLINDPLGFVVSKLSRFAKDNGYEVEIFFGTPCTILPKNIKELVAISTGAVRAFFSKGIYARGMAIPDEFLSAISSADMVLSDSFHALMFATIFRKNIRVLKPKNGRGSEGFSRLSEFVSEFLLTPTLCDSYEAAFQSFKSDPRTSYDEGRLNERRYQSMEWLKESIGIATGTVI